MDAESYFVFWEFLISGCILIALIGAKLFFSFVSKNETIKMKIHNFEQSVLSAFIPKTKKIRGRIIRIKKRESIIYYFSDYNSNSDSGLMLMPVYQNASPYKEIEHLVFLEEEESQKKYFVDLPEGIFDEIKEKRSKGLRNNVIFLYFKKYLFFRIFDHFELELV